MKILGLLSCGRSGADLFQSLLDGHDEILQFPGYVLFNKQLLKIFSLHNKKILAEEFVYETDGFIFTPSNLSVGANEVGEKSKNYKNTWNYSLKWKPAKYNTIDFLATTKKTPTKTTRTKAKLKKTPKPD